MAKQPSTVLDKTRENAGSLILGGVLLTIVGGLLMTAEGTAVFGWILGTVSVALFLCGLVLLHAATTERLIRARTTDLDQK
ncbi:MAG: hypothetical protein HOV77_23335 [Hamadaea sp.]|uniref:hypothetical protein n=1 Tax=Hamadaea sp. TaxID=2024425 RepID=UPI0018307B8A|nr:hypothetical protein [Hamadaea sp.]NUT22121.1 hypothetical protein [Hamadaea sp.]